VKVQACVQNPDSVAVTMTITMTLGEWRQLGADLPTRYPAWKLGSAITSVIFKLQHDSIESVEDVEV